MSTFEYYALSLRLREQMLGTNPSTDVMSEHIINKSRELIKKANSCEKKVSKSLKKYQGDTISEQKEIEELTGILRAEQELMGIREDIPLDLKDLLEYGKDLEARLDDYLKDKELAKSTVFLRDESGNICISSHMILGFMKSVMANVINSGNKTIVKSKVQMGECMSMDCKFVETLLMASEDILRDPVTKERELNIRPIRFNRMGNIISALAASEVLPVGTIFNTTLRVRKDSPLNKLDTLKFIFSHGKSIGLGAFRNSNNFGQFDYKLTELPDFKEPIEGEEDGWE